MACHEDKLSVDTGAKIHLERNKNKYSLRLAFSKLVASKKEMDIEGQQWKCCGHSFAQLTDIHRHISLSHSGEIESMSKNILLNGDKDARWAILKKMEDFDRSNKCSSSEYSELPSSFNCDDVFPWLPPNFNLNLTQKGPGKIILFYKYRDISNTEHVKLWQEELCRRLGLTGKVRIAKEGLNATVGGLVEAIDTYVKSVLSHPLFSDMTHDEFKESSWETNGSTVFSKGLKVGIYQEAVPMDKHPQMVSYKNAGPHLEPEEFHKALENHISTTDSQSVFVDCRNFYESKIGKFTGAVLPDIRKFSYWPEYVEKNKDLFKDKSIYMYCTGGIRCERGSAYLKSLVSV